MSKLSHDDIVIFLLAISAMLLLSRFVSELGKRIRLPIVMGELIVGITLGPTVLGQVYPPAYNYLFPLETNQNVALALDGIFNLSVIMLLFVAGMEVQLSIVLRQGKAAILTGLGGMIVPFITGYAVAKLYPEIFGMTSGSLQSELFPLFLGTALSISALPVIARILMDLNMFRTNVGMIIIAAAMLNDLIGWLFFSFILSLGGGPQDHFGLGYTITAILAFGAFMLFVGRRLINRALPWVQTKLSWPGGVLSISLGLCMLCAAFTQSINIHAILGAFIAGIAIGDSVQLREQARDIIHQFVTNFFAPLFFVSIGLKVNFIQEFDLVMVTVMLVLAFAGKVIGASLGALMGGVSKRNSLAIGFGLNARGAMEIILGTLAFNAGLITKPIFVALVIMAFVTSLTSGPLIRKFAQD
ncbi:MAG TPA: cation:proton antiporter [Bacteroidia bacterium]|nr:cation:proton antiporter [Bacteroidia bacterium]